MDRRLTHATWNLHQSARSEKKLHSERAGERAYNDRLQPHSLRLEPRGQVEDEVEVVQLGRSRSVPVGASKRPYRSIAVQVRHPLGYTDAVSER